MSGTSPAWATRLIFLVAGIANAGWAPMIPLIKARFGFDEGQLGALLLFTGIGSLLAMPFAGGWAARVGGRRVIGIAAVVCCSTLPMMGMLQSPMLAHAVLALFGASIGTLDVVMNLQAVEVEKAAGRPLMSGFHAFFSGGGIVGAGIATLVLTLSGSLPVVAWTVAGLGYLLLFAALPSCLTEAHPEPGPVIAIPRGTVAVIGLMCFALFLAEGAVLDWGGVFLREARGVDASIAGLGYVAFSVTMTLGRFTGDAVVAKLGRPKVLPWGSALAAAGYALVVISPHWFGCLVGFALVGIGAANVVPILFTAAGNQPDVPAHTALAGATSLGYLGFLLGPAMLGGVARAWGLSASLLGVAGLLFLVGVASRRVLRSI